MLLIKLFGQIMEAGTTVQGRGGMLAENHKHPASETEKLASGVYSAMCFRISPSRISASSLETSPFSTALRISASARR